MFLVSFWCSYVCMFLLHLFVAPDDFVCFEVVFFGLCESYFLGFRWSRLFQDLNCSNNSFIYKVYIYYLIYNIRAATHTLQLKIAKCSVCSAAMSSIILAPQTLQCSHLGALASKYGEGPFITGTACREAAARSFKQPRRRGGNGARWFCPLHQSPIFHTKILFPLISSQVKRRHMETFSPQFARFSGLGRNTSTLPLSW